MNAAPCMIPKEQLVADSWSEARKEKSIQSSLAGIHLYAVQAVKNMFNKGVAINVCILDRYNNTTRSFLPE